MNRSLQCLMIALVSLSTSAWAQPIPAAEVHVIGMYSAKPPRSAAYKQAVKAHLKRCDQLGEKCGAIWGSGWDKIGRKFPGRVTVTITRTGAPLTVVLSAYEHTKWTIKTAAGVQIQQIVLSGYHDQKIVGTPNIKDVPLQKLIAGPKNPTTYFYFTGDDREAPVSYPTFKGGKLVCTEPNESDTPVSHESEFSKALSILSSLNLQPTSIQASGEGETNSFAIDAAANSTELKKIRDGGSCYRELDGSLTLE